MYSSGEAQRSHWKEIKKFSRPLEERYKLPSGTGVHWAKEESSMLFEGPTQIPFDDHDAIDEHGWVVNGTKGFPLPINYVSGQPERPTPQNLLWMQLAMKAVQAILADAPSLMQINSEQIQLDNSAPKPPGFSTKVTFAGSKCHITCRNATVLTLKQVQDARKNSSAGSGARPDTKTDSHLEKTDSQPESTPKTGETNLSRNEDVSSVAAATAAAAAPSVATAAEDASANDAQDSRQSCVMM